MGNVVSRQAQFVCCPVATSITTSPPFSDSPVSDDNHNLFSNDEKSLIRKTWSELQQQSVVSDDDGGRVVAVSRGVRVFLRIFELDPEAQSVFTDRQASSLLRLASPRHSQCSQSSDTSRSRRSWSPARCFAATPSASWRPSSSFVMVVKVHDGRRRASWRPSRWRCAAWTRSTWSWRRRWSGSAAGTSRSPASSRDTWPSSSARWTTRGGASWGGAGTAATRAEPGASCFASSQHASPRDTTTPSATNRQQRPSPSWTHYCQLKSSPPLHSSTQTRIPVGLRYAHDLESHSRSSEMTRFCGPH